MTMTWEMFSARQTARAVLTCVFGAGLLLLPGGCSSAKVEHTYPEQIGGSDQHDPTGRSTNSDEEVGSLLDDEGLIGGLLNDDEDEAEAEAEEKNEEQDSRKEAVRKPAQLAQREDGKVGVNSYLWRAALETISFMPLNSADPYGGVIITDWRTNPQLPNERVKLTVYILDTELRADGVKVTVFRQRRDEAGVWVNAPAAEETQLEVEKAILTRARQLRVADLDED